MKKIGKKRAILLMAGILIVLLLLFLKRFPVSAFTYQTSTSCGSNAQSGNVEYIKFTVLSGGFGKFNEEKSKLEAMNIPQSGCKEYGFSPVDFTTLELYLF